MIIFATLGPSGTNHELVTQSYLNFHGLSDAKIVLVDKFDQAIELIASGKAHYAIQAAVHSETTKTVARAYFHFDIYVVDTFISPSHELAVLTRSEISNPKSLALQPSTESYIDTSQWAEIIYEPSTVEVGKGLLEQKYDSGLTLLSTADQNPSRFTVNEVIGSIDDPWIVYGKNRATQGTLLAWPDSPLRHEFRQFDD